MARDGSGNYSRVAGPYVNGVNIVLAEDHNGEFDDISSALSDSINKAGTKAFAADQAMGGFKLTGLGAGTANGHSVRYEQLTALSSTYQPLDATLTAVAALAWSSGNQFPYFTAADTLSLGTVTAAGLALIDDADASAQRTTLGAYGSGSTMLSAAGSGTTPGLAVGAANYGFLQTAGALTMTVNGTNVLAFGSNIIRPSANDEAALGSATIGFSDLFLANGGVIYNASTAILTLATTTLQVGSGVTLTNSLGIAYITEAYLNNRTADTSPDFAADYVHSYDTSAATDKKILLSKFEKAWTYVAGVTLTAASSFDWTSIPTGVSEIEIILGGASLSGNDALLVQIGDSGGLETSGYASGSITDSNFITSTAGFIIVSGNASYLHSGVMRLSRANSGGTVWGAQHGLFFTGSAEAGGGAKTLSAELDRIRLTVTGANTYDAGTAYVRYR